MIHPVWLHNQASSQNTPNSRLRNSWFSTGAVGWLPRATLENSLILCTLFSDACGRPVLLPVHRHPVSSNCRFHRRMLLGTRWINSITSTKLTLHGDYRVTPRTLQHTKRLVLYGRHFLTVCLSRSHSDSGVISRWPSRTRRFPLSFGGCQVNTRLMGTELCLFEMGWIILNNPVYWFRLGSTAFTLPAIKTWQTCLRPKYKLRGWIVVL